MSSIINAGLQGVKRGFDQVNRASEELTQVFQSQNDPVEPIIGMKLGEFQVKASSAVIKVGEELEKSVLDILA